MLILNKRGSPLKSAARLQKIVRVFAKHGFENLVQRANLGRFVPDKLLPSTNLNQYTVAERLRMSFEQLGPVFIKLGQWIAKRPDLIPKELAEEFIKLHGQVRAVPFAQMEPILKDHFKKDIIHIFSSFDEIPIGAASIAQVYQATLHNGDPVVLKVQRPGVDRFIREDTEVLYTLAKLLHRYVPESRLYNPVGIIDEFVNAISLETNFMVEANNIRRFQANFVDNHQVKIPRVYSEHSGSQVLVMERLEGIPLSHKEAFDDQSIHREEILKIGLLCYMQMVFKDGLFHGDLHAGNILLLSNNRIGLVDFGAVGRLDPRTQSSIISMLMALAQEDYERLAYEYVDLAPYTSQVDVHRLTRELRDLISPYHGLTSEHIDAGKVLMDSTSIASRHQILLPSELVLFFKSIMDMEAMGKLILKDFDFLSYSVEFASETLLKARYSPKKLIHETGIAMRDFNSLILSLPRQLKQFLRRMNSPDFSFEVEIQRLNDIKRAIELSSNLLFLGLIIGSLLLSSSLILIFDKGPMFFSLPLFSAIGYGLACFLGLVAVMNYTRK